MMFISKHVLVCVTGKWNILFRVNVEPHGDLNSRKRFRFQPLQNPNRAKPVLQVIKGSLMNI